MPIIRRNPQPNSPPGEASVRGSRRWLAVGVGLAVVLGLGVAHGLGFDRWKPSEKLRASAARLHDVPMDFGDWAAVKLPDMDDATFRAADIAGYINRRYVHRQTKTELNVLIVCGKPGPVIRHTPEVCYTGVGFEMATPTPFVHRSESDPTSAEFRVAKAVRADAAVSEQIRIYWTWGDRGSWAAPEGRPRLTWAYIGRPALFKMYVTRQLYSGDEQLQEEADFLTQLLPELQRTLFAGS